MGWNNRFLTYGASYFLIAHDLQSMPIYLMCVESSQGVIDQIHKIMEMFFWGHIGEVKLKH